MIKYVRFVTKGSLECLSVYYKNQQREQIERNITGNFFGFSFQKVTVVLHVNRYCTMKSVRFISREDSEKKPLSQRRVRIEKHIEKNKKTWKIEKYSQNGENQ